MIIIDILQTPLQDQLLNCMGMMMEVGQTDVQDVSQIIFNVLITVIALKQTQSTGDQVFNYLFHPPSLQKKSVLNCFNFEEYSMFIQLLNNSKITPEI